MIVASPVPTHEPYTLACIEAGKPVLCEKPLAGSPEAALRIAEADHARLVTVGFMRRYDPAYVELKRELDAGAIGAPLLVHCAHRNPSVHEFFDSAMIITDSAVHEVDVVRWLLGEEIARVTVHAPPPSPSGGLRDPLLLVLETASGRVVDVEAFVFAGYGYDIRCEVVGEAGRWSCRARSRRTSRRALPPPTGRSCGAGSRGRRARARGTATSPRRSARPRSARWRAAAGRRTLCRLADLKQFCRGPDTCSRSQ